MIGSKHFYAEQLGADFLVLDEDAADFLQSQFSNDLRPFDSGRCTYGLWLDVKGKVVADSVVLCEGAERFRVVSARCRGERIAAHLERHIIADDVVIEPRDPGYVFELGTLGVQALGLDSPAPGTFDLVEGGKLFSVREGSYQLLLDSAAQGDAWREKLIDSGFQAFTESAHARLRIAAGIPLVPDEIGETDLPGEGEFTPDAASLTKGCYLGQEVVARMHNIGKAQRRLFVVKGAGPVPEPPLALTNKDGKKVGELRTAYADEVGWLGVALLKTRFADASSELFDGGQLIRVSHPLREGQRYG